jgi:hypothetical protein
MPAGMAHGQEQNRSQDVRTVRPTQRTAPGARCVGTSTDLVTIPLVVTTTHANSHSPVRQECLAASRRHGIGVPRPHRGHVGAGACDLPRARMGTLRHLDATPLATGPRLTPAPGHERSGQRTTVRRRPLGSQPPGQAHHWIARCGSSGYRARYSPRLPQPSQPRRRRQRRLADGGSDIRRNRLLPRISNCAHRSG